ncbi:MAG: OmpA family protein, partial [Pseudomonadota bacterium]
ITDGMQPARGAPERSVWLGGIKFALSQLARLENGGEVNMRNAEFAIDGRARTISDYRRVRGALAQALPEGVRLVSDKVTPPAVSPYTWAMTFDGQRILLEGHVPTEQARSTLQKVIKDVFPSAAIVDRMAVASGAPNRWLLTSTALLRRVKPLQSSKIAMSDASITVTGIAVREATAGDVRSSLNSAIRQPYTANLNLKFIEPSLPIARPYETGVSVSETELTLSGFVPSQAQRQDLLQRATSTFPGRRVVDRLKIARGQPDGWSTCLNSGFDGLRQIGNGRLRMIDDEYTLFGETRDAGLQARLSGELRASTSRACKTSVALSLLKAPEPNLQWQAQRTDETIILSGEVPDSRTRTALIDRAQSLFPNIIVDDRMRVKPSTSQVWSSVARTGLELLARLRTGAATLSNQQLTITGEAPDTGAATVIKQRLASALAQGYSGADRIEVKSDAMIWSEREAKTRAEAEARRKQEEAERAREEAEARRRAEIQAAEERRREQEAARKAELARKAAEEAARRARAEAEARRKVEEDARKAEAEARRVEAEVARMREAQDRCQTALDNVKATGKINFELASSDIRRDSFAVLNRIADALLACDNVKVDIAGHTDSQGTEENNQRLSERRARSVVAYLVEAGVDRQRLSATGFGETQPVVPNDTS